MSIIIFYTFSTNIESEHDFTSDDFPRKAKIEKTVMYDEIAQSVSKSSTQHDST